MQILFTLSVGTTKIFVDTHIVLLTLKLLHNTGFYGSIKTSKDKESNSFFNINFLVTRKSYFFGFKLVFPLKFLELFFNIR